MQKERSINCEIEINASIEELWKSWTTTEGVKSFFAPDSKINLKIYGEYEMYFLPEAESGSRGGEDCKILAYQEKEFLSFTWNAPPHLPNVRLQKTVVIIRFTKLAEDLSKVTLTHIGWGNGEEWDQAFEYFSKAWSNTVLPRLKKRFTEGDIDWETI